MNRSDMTSAEWIATVRAFALKNYTRGGDSIVECFEDADILEEFESIEDVMEFCGMESERALNARWGEDTDSEVNVYAAAADLYED